MKEIEAIFALATAHKWIPLGALGTGILIRLLRSDTKFPLTIAGRWLPLVNLVLSVVYSVLHAVAIGGTWPVALLGGYAVASTSGFSYDIFVKALRGGKEFILPGLILPGVPPAPGKPVSIAPPAMGAEPDKAGLMDDDKGHAHAGKLFLILACLLALAVTLGFTYGCTPKPAADTVVQASEEAMYTAEQLACVENTKAAGGTKAESRACRAASQAKWNARWGIVVVVLDGGAK